MADSGPRPRDLLADVLLVANTTQHGLREDPWWFGVQAARRFAPASLRQRLATNATVGLGSAVAAFLADRPLVAAEILRRRSRSGRRRTRAGDRLAALLAIQVGARDALPADLASLPDPVRTQLALAVGDLSAAIALSHQPRERDRLLAQRRLLEPGFALPVERRHPDGRQRSAAGERPRVLYILTNSLPHTRSGYTARSQAVLAACRARGIEVEAVTRIGYPATIGRLGASDRDVVDGVPYNRLRAGHLASWADRRLEQQVELTGRLVERFAPHVLHTTTDFTNALVTQALAARHGLPWVYEMRGQLELTWVASRPEAFRDAAARSERVALLRAKETELACAANAVVVLSGVQRDDLVARGVPSERIHLAPNSADPALSKRTATPQQARAKLGLPEGAMWAGTVSSLVDYEGLDTFLRAVAAVRSAGYDLRGAIVGDGVARPGLEALARDLGVAEVVVFPGRVTSLEALDWYEALDVFVVPRRDTPVCRMVTPLKPVEAMALGRPVLASDLPALRELLETSGGGRLVGPAVGDWARELIALLADQEARAALAARGRQAAAQRTWDRVAATLEQIYIGIGGSR